LWKRFVEKVDRALPDKIYGALQGQVVTREHDRQAVLGTQLQNILWRAIRQGGFADDSRQSALLYGRVQLTAIAQSLDGPAIFLQQQRQGIAYADVRLDQNQPTFLQFIFNCAIP